MLLLIELTYCSDMAVHLQLFRLTTNFPLLMFSGKVELKSEHPDILPNRHAAFHFDNKLSVRLLNHGVDNYGHSVWHWTIDLSTVK